MSKYVQMFQNLSVTDFQFNAVMIRVWLILIICKLLICEFTYLLKFVVTPKNNMYDVLQSLIDLYRVVKNSYLSVKMFQLRSNKAAFCFLISALIQPTSILLVPIQCHILFIFLCFLVLISLFKIGKARSGKVLSQSRSGVFTCSLSSPNKEAS